MTLDNLTEKLYEKSAAIGRTVSYPILLGALALGSGCSTHSWPVFQPYKKGEGRIAVEKEIKETPTNWFLPSHTASESDGFEYMLKHPEEARQYIALRKLEDENKLTEGQEQMKFQLEKEPLIVWGYREVEYLDTSFNEYCTPEYKKIKLRRLELYEKEDNKTITAEEALELRKMNPTTFFVGSRDYKYPYLALKHGFIKKRF